jgi:tetratricopeptide (TPR) repeat protein
VAEELAHVGRSQDAIAVVEALSPDRNDWKSDGLRRVAAGHADVGSVDDAIATLNRISNLEQRAKAFQEFIRGRSKSDLARRKALDALLVLAPSVPDERNWRSGSLAEVARSLTDLGDIDRALEVARSVPEANFRAGALTYVGNALIQSRKFDAAVTVINEALAAKSQGGVEIAVALARLGKLANLADASRRSHEMLDAALIAARQERSFPETAIGAVATGWAELGEAGKCLEVLAKLPISFYKESSFYPIKSSIEKLAKLGLTSDVRKFIDSMTEQNHKSLMLLALALTYDNASRRALLLEIERVAELITGEADQSFVFSKLAEAWVQMDQYRYGIRLSDRSRSFDRIRVQYAVLNRYLERNRSTKD